MKHLLILLFLSFSISAQAQKKRYYPSLSSLLNLKEEATFPAELKYIEDWYEATTDRVFYTNLQESSSPRGDASFRSLGIIPRGEKRFEFLNSGFAISFNDALENKETPIAILNNNTFPVFAYTNQFALQSFDPNNNSYLFFLLMVLNNLSNEQALAHFVNTFSEPIDDESSIKRFIMDINAVNKLNIDENLFDDSKTTLKTLCNLINKEMPQVDCVYAAYKTYIETNDINTTRQYLNQYYRTFERSSIEETLNETVLPYGNFEFLDQTVTIHLPEKYFKYISKDFKKEPVAFQLQNIKFDLDYSFEKNGYVFSLRLYPHYNNGIKDSFAFKHVYLSVLTGKEEIDEVTLKGNQLQYIEIFFYNDHLKVYIESNDDSQISRQRFELFKNISIKN